MSYSSRHLVAPGNAVLVIVPLIAVGAWTRPVRHALGLLYGPTCGAVVRAGDI